MPSTVAIGQCGQGATSLAFNFNSLKSTYPPRASGCYHVGQHSSKLGLGSGHRHASSMPTLPQPPSPPPGPWHSSSPRSLLHVLPAPGDSCPAVPRIHAPRPRRPPSPLALRVLTVPLLPRCLHGGCPLCLEAPPRDGHEHTASQTPLTQRGRSRRHDDTRGVTGYRTRSASSSPTPPHLGRCVSLQSFYHCSAR